MIGSLSDVDHYIARAVCPWCGKEGDVASGLDTDDRPSPGDYAVCIYCAGVNCYDEVLRLVRCPEEVWRTDPDNFAVLVEARRVVRINNALMKRQ